MSPKTAPHFLYGAQNQRVRPEHDCKTCWSTRASTGDRQTTTACLVLTRHQAQLSAKDCSPGNTKWRSTFRSSEEKLNG
ncbi:hypothetical protein DPMN_061062 [Dreissena polymorpha]|uniref:Uncharacterized protein n=1 Tax=Dreissena polymorpha TaxID=45954 RepID=A0A9D4C719_DREPO|nr:hypothetical protein DPMN_061062 [Dreissena polymorpha]